MSSPVVSAGQDGIPSWRADSGRRMSVRKDHALVSDAIYVGSRYFRFRIQRADISKPLIIGQDKNNVWPVRCVAHGCGCANRRSDDGSECSHVSGLLKVSYTAGTIF